MNLDRMMMSFWILANFLPERCGRPESGTSLYRLVSFHLSPSPANHEVHFGINSPSDAGYAHLALPYTFNHRVTLITAIDLI
jgi:hypothetical protein